MAKFLTDHMVRKVGSSYIEWLEEGDRLETVKEVAWYIKPNLSLGAFRRYLDGVLHHITRNIGKEHEQHLGYYTVYCSPDCGWATIKKSSGRIPRKMSSLMSWANWDVEIDVESKTIVKNEYSVHVTQGIEKPRWMSPPSGLRSSLPLLFTGLSSHILLQSLLADPRDIDLTKTPLPREDLHCRVGKFKMTYDHLAEEWRVWLTK